MINVAIVEATDDIREGLKVLINGSDGYRCVADYSSAEAALCELVEKKPDVVLMDINLPGKSGIECTRELKERIPSLPIMMLTIFENDEQIFESMINGNTVSVVAYVLPNNVSGQFAGTLQGTSITIVDPARSNLVVATGTVNSNGTTVSGSTINTSGQANGTWSGALVWSQVSIFNLTALASKDTLLFAGSAGGIYRSTNFGTTWTLANTGMTNNYVSSLSVQGTTIIAGTLGGIFRSTKNGSNRVAASSGLTSGWVRALVVNGTNTFAGTNTAGVFLSTDSGANWTAVNTGLPNLAVGILAANNASNIYSAIDGIGVYLSTNNGTRWSVVNTGLTNKRVQALAASGSNVLAGTIFESGGIFCFHEQRLKLECKQ